MKLGSLVYSVGNLAEVEHMQDSRDLSTVVPDVMTTGTATRRQIASSDKVLNDIAVAVHLLSGATVASSIYYRKLKSSKTASVLSRGNLGELKFLPDLMGGLPAVEVHLAGRAPGSCADDPMTRSYVAL